MSHSEKDFKISVVIPAYNRTQLLRKTLLSFCDQTLDTNSFEIIVVDDGSTEDLKSLIESLKQETSLNLKYYHQENAGPAKARNLGVDNANSSFIALIDSDVIPSKTWLETGLSIINTSDKIGAVEGKTIVPDKSQVTPFTHQTSNLCGGRYLTCNLFIRKELCHFYERYQKLYEANNAGASTFREDTDLAFSILSQGYEIPFAENVIAFHPSLPSNFSTPFKLAKRYQFDALLKKRFPKLYKTEVDYHYVANIKIAHLRKKIYGILVLSYIFLFLAACLNYKIESDIILHIATFAFILAFGSNFYLHIKQASIKKTGLLGLIVLIPTTLFVPVILYYNLIKGSWILRHEKQYTF